MLDLFCLASPQLVEIEVAAECFKGYGSWCGWFRTHIVLLRYFILLRICSTERFMFNASLELRARGFEHIIMR